LPEQFLQQGSATFHSRADRARRNAQYFRRFIVSKSLDIDEDYDCPECLWQRVDRLEQFVAKQIVKKRALRIRPPDEKVVRLLIE
jgi:hypothetical protein